MVDATVVDEPDRGSTVETEMYEPVVLCVDDGDWVTVDAEVDAELDDGVVFDEDDGWLVVDEEDGCVVV